MRGRRIALYGPRAAGKTTVAQILASSHIDSVLLSSAEPLYRLQTMAYRIAQIEISEGQQDATTLAAMATILRRLDPDVLAKVVVRRVREAETAGRSALFICPDSRIQDRPLLELNGFEFVYVFATETTRRTRRSQRGDLGPINDDDDLAPFVEGDPRIDNVGTLEDLRRTVQGMFPREPR